MLQAGEAEPLKAAVHVVLGTVAAVCLLYNAAAWWRRRERHLAVNVVLYGALTAYEGYQVSQHARAA